MRRVAACDCDQKSQQNPKIGRINFSQRSINNEQPVKNEDFFNGLPGYLIPKYIVLPKGPFVGEDGAFTATPGHIETTRYAKNNFHYTATPQETFDVALGWHGIKPTKTSQPWETVSSPTVAAKREYVMFGEGRLNGSKIGFCAMALVLPEGQNSSLMVLSAAPRIFRAWHGPLSCARRSGYLKNPAAIGVVWVLA